MTRNAESGVSPSWMDETALWWQYALKCPLCLQLWHSQGWPSLLQQLHLSPVWEQFYVCGGRVPTRLCCSLGRCIDLHCEWTTSTSVFTLLSLSICCCSCTASLWQIAFFADSRVSAGSNCRVPNADDKAISDHFPHHVAVVSVFRENI